MEVLEDGDDYVLKLEASLNAFGVVNVNHVSNFKISRDKDGLYRSLENYLTNSSKIGFVPIVRSNYLQFFNYNDKNVELTMESLGKTKKLNISSNTRGPFALLINFLSRDDNIITPYLGNIKGNNDDDERSVCGFVEEDEVGNGYLISMIIPPCVFLKEEVPLRIYYNKDIDSGVSNITRLELFAKDYLGKWVIAKKIKVDN